jgi:L-2-hydroxyglutarate oxidase LhgO
MLRELDECDQSNSDVILIGGGIMSATLGTMLESWHRIGR